MKFTDTLVTLFFFLLASPITAVVALNEDDAASFDLEQYCRTAQQIIATTELEATIQRPPTLPDYLRSKPEPYQASQHELVVQQFDGHSPAVPELQTVLCKMKDAGSIRKYFGHRKARRTTSCADVHRAVVDSVVAQIQQEDAAPPFVSPTIVYDRDWSCLTGSQWSKNSPAVTAYRDDAAGTVHLVGKSLTGLPWWFPRVLPALRPYIGVYYCQVSSADSIRSILQGTTVPPSCGPPPTHPFHLFNTALECPRKAPSSDEL